MDSQNQEKPIDIGDLQKEVIEMRQLIPDTYKAVLEKDFEKFKNRLTKIVSQRNSIQYSASDNPAIDMSIFESNVSQRYDVEDLTRYIHNAETFVRKLKRISEKKKI